MKNMVRACLDRGSHTLRSLLQNGTLLLILLFCLLYLPFLDQAFHIDDTGFIEPSRTLGWNPLQIKVSENEYRYGLPDGPGHSVPLPYTTSHPVLLPYIVKLVTSVFSERETPLHLSFLIFPALAAFSLVKLIHLWLPDSKEIREMALVLFLSMPAFLVNSHTIMSDVPTLSFLLTTILFYARAFENNEGAFSVYAGSLFLAFAVFTTYQMLAFVPLLAFYAYLKKKLNLHTVLSLLIPVVLLSLWLYLVYRLYHVLPIMKKDFSGQGAGIAAELMRGYLPMHFLKKVVSVFTTTAASLFFIEVIRYLGNRSLKILLRQALLIAAAIFIPFLFIFRYHWVGTALLSLYTAIGYTILRDVATAWYRNGRRITRPRNIFLMAWIVTVIGYNVFILPFGSARYLLPGIVPMFLLLLSDPDVPSTVRTFPRAVTATIVIASIFGFLNAYADYQHAQTYREMTREMELMSQENGRSSAVWYIGAWGMHHYMSTAGFKRLPEKSADLKAGDYIIEADMPKAYKPSPEVMKRLRLKKIRQYESWLPLRVFNGQSRAGFYSAHWGLLPFAFSLKPNEVFQIWEVVR